MTQVETKVADEKKVVDEKKAAKKAAKKELRAKQKEAFAKVITAIEKSSDAEVKKVFQAFTALKSERVASAGNPNYAKFVAFVVEKKSVSEDEVFKVFKVGRKDCAGFLRKFLRNCVEPKDRVWIEFTPNDGMYKLLGTGVKAPKEYTGYVPTDDITDLKQPNLK